MRKRKERDVELSKARKEASDIAERDEDLDRLKETLSCRRSEFVRELEEAFEPKARRYG